MRKSSARRSTACGYPVYTRKVHTDVCYLACAQKAAGRAGRGLSAVRHAQRAYAVGGLHMARGSQATTDYEFQCLHGMGETLYDQVVGEDNSTSRAASMRRSASHETLLAYLVRRLLENGANSSFVNQIVDENVTMDTLMARSVHRSKQLRRRTASRTFPLPRDLYGAERRNSAGLDLSQRTRACAALACGVPAAPQASSWQLRRLLANGKATGRRRACAQSRRPPRRGRPGGRSRGRATWRRRWRLPRHLRRTGGQRPGCRAQTCLSAPPICLKQHRAELMALAVREAGKSLPNAIAEVREAVDFLRYYAQQVQTGSKCRSAARAGGLHQPLEFSAGDFYGRGQRRACRRQYRACKAGRANAADRGSAQYSCCTRPASRAAALQFLPGRGETVGARS